MGQKKIGINQLDLSGLELGVSSVAINAADYDAVPGSADITTELQAAIDAAYAAKKPLYIPGHATDKYLVTGLVLPGPMHIVGFNASFDGGNETAIGIHSSAVGDVKVFSFALGAEVYGTTLERFTIYGRGRDLEWQDIGFVGHEEGTKANLNIVFKGMQVRDFGFAGVALNDAFNVAFYDTKFRRCGAFANEAGGAIWFDRDFFTEFSEGSGTGNACTGVQLSNTYFTGNRRGIGVAEDQLTCLTFSTH